MSMSTASLEADSVASMIKKLDDAVAAGLDALVEIGAHEQSYELPDGARDLARCLAGVHCVREWLKSETQDVTPGGTP